MYYKGKKNFTGPPQQIKGQGGKKKGNIAYRREQSNQLQTTPAGEKKKKKSKVANAAEGYKPYDSRWEKKNRGAGKHILQKKKNKNSLKKPRTQRSTVSLGMGPPVPWFVLPPKRTARSPATGPATSNLLAIFKRQAWETDPGN